MKTNVASLPIGSRFSFLNAVYVLEDRSPRGPRRYLVQVMTPDGVRSKFAIQDTDMLELA